MTFAETKKRHAQLVEEIRRLDHAHHVEGQQFITGSSYEQIAEQLFRELHALEEQFPKLVTSNSPTKAVSKRKSEAFKAEIKKLRSEIERHRQLYYKGSQEISDYEFDKLEERLKELEKRRKTKEPINRRIQEQLPLADSPTEQVGGAHVEGFVRFRHLVPMRSLHKIKVSSHPTKEEEPDPDKRNRAQDENTLIELRAFDATIRKHLGRDKIQYVIEPKVDGTSISVHYHYGKLALGVTRGLSGSDEGDDITANVKTISSIPHRLNLKKPPALLEVRGEAYISIEDFDSLNAKLTASGQKPFPNARNVTSGTLKQLDPNLVAQRPIRAVFYGIGAVDGIDFIAHSEMLESLTRFGLPTPKFRWVCNGIEKVLKTYREKIVVNYDEDRDLRRQLPYEIDGIVIKVNTLVDWSRIPSRSNSPGYAIVHKPVPWVERAETVLKDITVQVGRIGTLTPVAELEPIFVQGSTISRATLHNEDEIRRKDIRIGDTVVIRKAGMVIPEVVEVLKTKRPEGAKEFDLFKYVGGKCPACGGTIAKEKIAGGAEEEVAWRCQNIAGCPAQLTRRVEYFAQRKALDLESLGGIVAEKLVERGLVKEPLDLFKLKLEQLGKLNLGTDEEPRVFGEKNAAKILDALQHAKTVPLHRWLLAIGIPNVGEVTAIDIGRFHSDLEHVANSKMLEGIKSLGDLYGALAAVSPFADEISEKEKIVRREPFNKRKQELLDLGGQLVKEGWAQKSDNWTMLEQKGSKAVPKFLPLIDYIPAENVLNYFKSETGKKLLARLKTLHINPHPALKASEQGPLMGKTFVLTGTLPNLSRDEASAMIREAGGNVTGSVSKNTDYLLTGESAGSKLDKAKELGVIIISEEEFLTLLGQSKKSKKTAQGSFL